MNASFLDISAGGSVAINGTTLRGKNIVISNGTVFVDGRQDDGTIITSGDIEVIVDGNVGSIQTVSGDINIKGDVNGPTTTVSGDVKATNINGPVKTVSGDIIAKGKISA